MRLPRLHASLLAIALLVVGGTVTATHEETSEVPETYASYMDPLVVAAPSIPVQYDFAAHCLDDSTGALMPNDVPAAAGFACNDADQACSIVDSGAGLHLIRTILPHGDTGYESGNEHNQFFDRFYMCVTDESDNDGYYYAVVTYENSITAGDNCGGYPDECQLKSGYNPDEHVWTVESGVSTMIDFSPDPSITIGASDCKSLSVTVAGTGAGYSACANQGIKLARGGVSGVEANFRMEVQGSPRDAETSAYMAVVKFQPGNNVVMWVDQANEFYHDVDWWPNHSHTYKSEYSILVVGDTDIEETLT